MAKSANIPSMLTMKDAPNSTVRRTLISLYLLDRLGVERSLLMGTHALVKSLEPLVPSWFWEAYKRKHNRIKYVILWRRRRVVKFSHDGVPISLVIVDPGDVIQAQQAAGAFYEQNELEILKPYFPKGGVFVDVGANTGQHSIFFAKILGASNIILFEPIEETCWLLRENIRLNGLGAISDISHLGIGLSDRTTTANFTLYITNLGAASLHEGDGPIPTALGDDLIGNKHTDFIKIDAEGYELKVLTGLKKTINRDKPPIYVEVDDTNRSRFYS